MLKLCLTVILLGCCLTQINGENLPVFIWGQKTPSFLPALSQLNSDEFVTLVKSQSDKETLTVVFVESRLSVEDFSQCKLKTATCFENLRKIEQKTYLTAVEDPVKALEASFAAKSQKSISLSNDGDLSEKVDAAGSEKLLFVYLDDIESNEDFAKHDELMNKLYSSLTGKRENVIAIYTARHPSFVYSKPLVRKAREAAEAAPAKQVIDEPKPAEPKQDDILAQKVLVADPPHFMIAMRRIWVTKPDQTTGPESVDLTAATVTFNLSVPTTGTATIAAAGHKIDITIELSGGTWRANTFAYNDNTKFRAAVPVSAYDRKSFGCGDLRIINVIEKIEVTFEDVQIQPLFQPEASEILTEFSSHFNDCVGFFSPAIWGALFVVILLMSILSCGLTFIMDIKTMDRFDDPKGKTITVNAQE